MTETSERFGVQHMLFDPMQVVDHRHATPAHTKGRMYIGLGAVHYLAQLVPIGYIFEGQVLDRRARNDQTVKLLISYV